MKTKTLCELSELIDYGISQKAVFGGEGPRFLRITDIQNGLVDWKSVPGVEAYAGIQEKAFLRDGDIVFARTGGTVGKTYLVKSPPESVFASYLIRVRSSDAIGSDFLSLFLQSPKYWNQILSDARGGAQPNINSKAIGALEIPLPPLDEQKRIAAELDEQLAAIEIARAAAERQVEAAKALERSLLGAAFPNTTPVRIGYPSDSLPKGWQWQRLLDVARLESGHTPSRRHPEWWSGETSWLALPDIRKLDGQIVESTKETINDDGLANSAARILPANTVALSRTASVGFVTIFGKPMATSQDFMNWVCGENLGPRFLLHGLRASYDYLLGQASGAVHRTIYMPAAKDMHLALPDFPTQQGIVTQLDGQLAAQRETLKAAQTQLKAIQALPAAVLRGVFG